MARQKQRVPLQRAPSSDVMQAPPDLPEPSKRHQNGLTEKSALANGPTKPAGSASTSEDSPGLVQLAVCVAGIYASL
jgi:solute carrier family 35 (UDP-galactose transporter), member B1